MADDTRQQPFVLIQIPSEPIDQGLINGDGSVATVSLWLLDVPPMLDGLLNGA
jgi:hypothetical protein